MRYFETLHEPHTGFLRHAGVILELLEVELDGPLIHLRLHAARQQEVECGWMICHHLEEALRVAAGHPKQSQGWLDAKRGFAILSLHRPRAVRIQHSAQKSF